MQYIDTITAAEDSVIFGHLENLGKLFDIENFIGSLFLIFFFNNHPILWVIQYIDTTAAADSGIHLDT